MFQESARRCTWQVISYYSLSLFASLLLLSRSFTTVHASQAALWNEPNAAQQTGSGSAAQDEKEVRTLELGQSIERELSGGQVHYYQIALTQGQFVQVVVHQRGINVVVTVFGPDGEKLSQVDSLKDTQGPEPVSVIAEASGNYRLEVGSLRKEAPVGRYEVKIEEIRTATPQDRSRVAALRAFMEGEQLRARRKAESLRKSLEKYEEALRAFRAIEDHRGEARTLNNIGRVYSVLGEKQKALDYFNQAFTVFRAAEDHSWAAATLNDIGRVYSVLGEKQKALDHFNQALPIFRAMGDRRGEAATLSNIGRVYSVLGEKQKALDCYNQVLPLRRAVDDRRGEAATLNDIGRVYSVLGEKQKALDHFNQALPIFRAVGDRSGEAATLNNIGSVYDSLGEKRKALDYFNQALPLRRAAGDRQGEAATLNNIGAVYNYLGEKWKALDCYNQALSIFRAVRDRRGEAATLNNIGSIYDSLGEKQKALDYYNQALPLKRAIGDGRGEARTLNDIGRVYSVLGEKQKALDYFNQALPLRRAVGDRRGEAMTLYHIARHERELGDLVAAQSHIEDALNIIESLRSKIGSQELRTSYFASVQNFYEFYVDLLMWLHNLRPAEGHNAVALQASERARARSLLELLTEANVDIRQGVDPALLERERTLQQQLNTMAERQRRMLSDPQTKEQAAVVEKEIAVLTTEYQQVEAQIRIKSPRYAALTQPQPLSLKEIQTQVLDSNTLLLEYSLGKDRSYLWSVTPTSLDSFELPKRTEIETAAKRVYYLLTARNRRVDGETVEQRRARVARADDAYPKAAAALSQMLLGQVAAQLGKKRLVIVSDGALQYLPFAALPRPMTTASGRARVDRLRHSRRRVRSAMTVGARAGASPLIVEHEIVNLPSASALAVLRRELQGRRSAAKAVAVLADPVFDQDDERVKAIHAGKNTGKESAHSSEQTLQRDVERAIEDLGETDTTLRLPRLYHTRWEAQAITSLVPAEESMQALDFAASRTTATSAELAQYRIVHFATHAFINNVHPELSGVVLSLVDERGEPQDGFLRAHEIFNLKLPAELVVLSACRTGLGKEVKGEGLIGLTRGFMYAGAPRVVVSLWSLNDKPTAELMARFYKKMMGAERLPPTAALRTAQVEMWKDERWKQPYFWAAFILQGEWK